MTKVIPNKCTLLLSLVRRAVNAEKKNAYNVTENINLSWTFWSVKCQSCLADPTVTQCVLLRHKLILQKETAAWGKDSKQVVRAFLFDLLLFLFVCLICQNRICFCYRAYLLGSQFTPGSLWKRSQDKWWRKSVNGMLGIITSVEKWNSTFIGGWHRSSNGRCGDRKKAMWRLSACSCFLGTAGTWECLHQLPLTQRTWQFLCYRQQICHNKQSLWGTWAIACLQPLTQQHRWQLGDPSLQSLLSGQWYLMM